MARRADSGRGLRIDIGGLRRCRIFRVMAGQAVARILRVHDVIEVIRRCAESFATETTELVVLGQINAGMDLVNHDTEIQRGTDATAVEGAGLMAGNALLDVLAGTAVECELLVAMTTRAVLLGRDRATRDTLGFTGCGDDVERGIECFRFAAENFGIANLHTYPVREIGLE